MPAPGARGTDERLAGGRGGGPGARPGARLAAMAFPPTLCRARRCAAAALCALALALAAAAGAAAATPEVREHPVPVAGASPVGIATGWDGSLWFTQRNRNFAGRLVPGPGGSAAISELSYGIPGEGPYGADGIAAAGDGNMWFALREGISGTRLTMGRIFLSAAPAVGLRELTPTKPQPRQVVGGPRGGLWFTRGAGNMIGRLDPAKPTEADEHFAIPPPPGPPGPAANPDSIAAGHDGAIWFTQPGRNLIGRATTGAAPLLTNTPVASEPWGIAAGPDGNLWFTQPRANSIARLTPGGEVTAFPLPTPHAQPFRIAPGPDGALWFTEPGTHPTAGTGPQLGQVGRILPYGSDAAIQASIEEFPVPTSDSTPGAIAAGPDGALWFTQSAGDRIGRVTTPLAPPQARTPLGAAPISIPSVGPASPYPSALNVSGLEGRVTRVRVDLYGLFHAVPEDLDLLLVGPGGQKAIVVSDAGFIRALYGSTLTVEDAAPVAAPRNGMLVSGRYRPTDHEPGESLPAPAPAGPYAASFATFAGTDPNGTWRLYVADDFSLGSGRLLGWGLRIETDAAGDLPPGPTPPGDGTPTPPGHGGGPPGGTVSRPPPTRCRAGSSPACARRWSGRTGGCWSRCAARPRRGPPAGSRSAARSPAPLPAPAGGRRRGCGSPCRSAPSASPPGRAARSGCRCRGACAASSAATTSGCALPPATATPGRERCGCARPRQRRGPAAAASRCWCPTPATRGGCGSSCAGERGYSPAARSPARSGGRCGR